MARRIAAGLFSVSVFASASFAGVLTHFQLPIARKSIAAELDRLLASTFAGRVRVEGVESIGPHGLRAKEVTADDPDGVRVLRASDVELDVSLVDLARSSLFDQPIVVDGLHVRDANVSLDETAKGLRIARAFAPRKASNGPSKLDLTVSGVALDHAWIHGTIAHQIVDADVSRATADLRAADGKVAIGLGGADLVARALPRHADLAGHVSGHLASGGETDLVASFSGRAAGVGVSASGRVAGDRFEASVSAPSIPASRIRALVPGAPIHETMSLVASASGTTSDFALGATGTLGGARLAASGRFDAGHLRTNVRAKNIDLRAFEPSLRPSVADADATIDLAGGVTTVRGHYDPRGARASFAAELGPHALDARLTADVSDVGAALAPLLAGPKFAGRGTIRASAHLDRDRDDLDARGEAQLEDVAVAGASAGVLRATVTARGPESHPRFALDAFAERTVVPNMRIASAEIHAEGEPSDARVRARLAANGTLDLAARASVGSGTTKLDDLEVREDGALVLRGALASDRGATRVRLVGRRIDLAALRRTLGFEPALAGSVALDVDATLAGRALQGRVALDARGVDWDRVQGLDALLHASSFDRATAVSLRARMPSLGWVSVESGDLRLAGPSLARSSWERATGTVSVDGTVSLGELAALLGRERKAEGWTTVSLVARRASERAEPDVTVAVKSPAIAFGRRAWPVALDARAHLDEAGAFDAHVDAAHRAERARLDVTSSLAWDDLAAGRAPDFARLPFTADLDVPSFEMGAFCTDLGVRCQGSLAAAVHATGPIDRGHGTIAVTLSGFRSNVSPIAELADASLVGTFDRGGGKATLAVSHFGSSDRELQATADVHVPSDPRAWWASIDARANGLPLRLPPVAGGERAYATASGTASIQNLHRDARARIDLRADDLGWGDVTSDRATLAGEYDGATLALAATLRAQTSSAELHVTAPATWGAALAPHLTDGAPVRLAARASDFRLRLLQPAVPLSVGSIDGRLDADVSGTVARAPMRLALRGSAKIANGSVESSNVGEIQDLAASIDFRDDGTIALHDAHFRGTRGLVTVTGRALAPGGDLREIDVGARVAKNDPYPLVVSGQRVGDVWGNVQATARPRGRGFDVKLEVPTLHVQLPDVARGAVQSLEPASDVSIGVRRNGRLEHVALAPPTPPSSGIATPLHVDVTLGKDVRIARDDNLSIGVTGTPTVDVGATTRAFGSVDLARGMIDIEGRRFAIEHGVVTFDGDPTNPMISVVADWTASDRTRVTARYAGRADRGKLDLSSDPPHTEDEIVALLVFGSSGGPTPGSGGTTGAVAAATAVGGASVATEPLNKALEQLTHANVKTRVDTSGTTAKSAVQVQIAKHIWAQVAYVLGLPPPGTEPDRTWLTLAWYATAHWSFDFTIGDHGSTIIDALWERRY